MAINTVVLKGTIRGMKIELENETGLPDGQAVIVAVRLPEGDARSCAPKDEWDDLEEILSHSRGRPIKIPKPEPSP